MTQEVSQTETGEVFLASFDLIAGTSESTRAKTAETFLELLGARVRNPNTRSAYQVAWRSFLRHALVTVSRKTRERTPGTGALEGERNGRSLA
jgi:hypothetical protein